MKKRLLRLITVGIFTVIFTVSAVAANYNFNRSSSGYFMSSCYQYSVNISGYFVYNSAGNITSLPNPSLSATCKGIPLWGGTYTCTSKPSLASKSISGKTAIYVVKVDNYVTAISYKGSVNVTFKVSRSSTKPSSADGFQTKIEYSEPYIDKTLVTSDTFIDNPDFDAEGNYIGE